MGSRIKRMTSRDVEVILKKYGFELISQKGSHRKWKNKQLGLQVIVPQHRGKILPIGTLNTIFRGAEIPDSEWKN